MPTPDQSRLADQFASELAKSSWCVPLLEGCKQGFRHAVENGSLTGAQGSELCEVANTAIKGLSKVTS